MTKTLTVARVELEDPAAQALIAALDEELRALYPEDGANHFSLAAEELAPGRGTFLVAFLDGAPAGCGALRSTEPGTAELKRMFTRPSLRGNGVAQAVLTALEAEARRLGVTRLVLETGTRQGPAIALYERNGFQRIPLYGEYLASPDTSLCLEKRL